MSLRLRSFLAGEGLGPMLVKAVTGSAGLRIAGMGFGFLVGVQLARGLGAEGYGIYGVAMSIIALLTVPTEFGLPQLLTREVAAAHVKQDWGRMKGILGWSTRVSMMIAAAIAAAVMAWLLLSGQGLGSTLGSTLLVGLVMVPLVALVALRSAALRGLQLIVRGQVPDVLLRPMFYSLLLFIVPMLVMPLTPPLAMALGAVAAGLALVIASSMLGFALPAQIGNVARVVDTRDWWSSALPMAMTEGARLLQSHLLVLVLGVVATATDVGLYRVAASVALLLGLPAGLFGVVGAPIFARLHAAGDQARLQRTLGWLAVGMTAGALFLALPFFVGGESLLALIFGDEYRSANGALLIIAGGLILSSTLGANAVLLAMTGHQTAVTRASLIALVCLLLVSVPLIHLWGIVGAAIANAISLLLWKVLLWVSAKRLAGYDTSLCWVIKGWRS